MERGRRGTGLGMGEFPSLFLFNYSFPVPYVTLDGSGCRLEERF